MTERRAPLLTSDGILRAEIARWREGAERAIRRAIWDAATINCRCALAPSRGPSTRDEMLARARELGVPTRPLPDLRPVAVDPLAHPAAGMATDHSLYDPAMMEIARDLRVASLVSEALEGDPDDLEPERPINRP